ncbi:MAG: hypothetical protein EPO36_05880 [Chloroflexota bacterium]|nr:MAG: hypothetical protein EPO36_05880 [Chloroflexota bacterium]
MSVISIVTTALACAAGTDLGFLAVVHPNAQAAAQDQLEMVGLARRRADDRLHILGAPPAGLEDGPPDHQASAEVDVAAAATPERSIGVGMVQAPIGEPRAFSGHVTDSGHSADPWRSLTRGRDLATNPKIARRQDSNLQPSAPESDARSAELQACG